MLPKETSRLPREKRIPEQKAETKWEKYAKEKGIQKKKKERMVWNEATQQFTPSWGYKRGEGSNDDLGILEIKKNQDPYVDPYAIKQEEKVKKTTKNMAQQVLIFCHSGLKKIIIMKLTTLLLLRFEMLE